MTTNGLELGLHHSTHEIEAPRTYLVSSGTRTLTRLEGGDVRHWADQHVFMVNEATGDFMAHGEHGTFAACWPAAHRAGRSLHAFLLRLNFDYFMERAMVGDHMEADLDATVAEMKSEIVQERRCKAIDHAAARRLWNDVDDLDVHSGEDAFVRAMHVDPDLYERFCDGGFVVRRRPRDRAVRFWEETWQAFRVDVLQPWRDAEMTAATAAAA